MVSTSPSQSTTGVRFSAARCHTRTHAHPSIIHTVAPALVDNSTAEAAATFNPRKYQLLTTPPFAAEVRYQPPHHCLDHCTFICTLAPPLPSHSSPHSNTYPQSSAATALHDALIVKAARKRLSESNPATSSVGATKSAGTADKQMTFYLLELKDAVTDPADAIPDLTTTTHTPAWQQYLHPQPDPHPHPELEQKRFQAFVRLKLSHLTEVCE